MTIFGLNDPPWWLVAIGLVVAVIGGSLVRRWTWEELHGAWRRKRGSKKSSKAGVTKKAVSCNGQGTMSGGN